MKLEDLVSDKGYFYIMHLSWRGRQRKELWNYARENDLIGLDYPPVVKDDWNKVRDMVKENLPKIWVRQFDMFCKEMKVGDIVVVLEGWHSILGIARITGNRHQYRKELSEERKFFDHVRKVQWVKKYEYGKHPKTPSLIEGFNNTLYKAKSDTRRWSALVDFTW